MDKARLRAMMKAIGDGGSDRMDVGWCMMLRRLQIRANEAEYAAHEHWTLLRIEQSRRMGPATRNELRYLWELLDRSEVENAKCTKLGGGLGRIGRGWGHRTESTRGRTKLRWHEGLVQSRSKFRGNDRTIRGVRRVRIGSNRRRREGGCQGGTGWMVVTVRRSRIAMHKAQSLKDPLWRD